MYKVYDEPLSLRQKCSFKGFCKLVWVASNINLHYVTFCEENSDELRKLFKPVKENDSGEAKENEEAEQQEAVS